MAAQTVAMIVREFHSSTENLVGDRCQIKTATARRNVWQFTVDSGPFRRAKTQIALKLVLGRGASAIACACMSVGSLARLERSGVRPAAEFDHRTLQWQIAIETMDPRQSKLNKRTAQTQKRRNAAVHPDQTEANRS